MFCMKKRACKVICLTTVVNLKYTIRETHVYSYLRTLSSDATETNETHRQ